MVNLANCVLTYQEVGENLLTNLVQVMRVSTMKMNGMQLLCQQWTLKR